MGPTNAPLSLPAQLSAALVAFTIEFDNTAETRMIHQTTTGESTRGPWLVSQVMWANVLQHIPDEGISVHDLADRARTERLALNGLQRWGYIEIDPARGDGHPFVRLKPSARRGATVWRDLAAEIEDRWIDRRGSTVVQDLRRALTGVVEQVDLALPRYLPLVYPTKGGRMEACGLRDPAGPPPAQDADLSVLLSQVLHTFTLDAEARAKLSVANCSTTLRVVDEAGVRLRDLPLLTGVSKEANAMCMGFFVRRGFMETGPEPGASRGKVLRLTSEGKDVRDRFAQLLRATERRWEERFGSERVTALRRALALVVGPSATADSSPLFAGLEPPSGTWRSTVARPVTLPAFPLVLHRGGYPDGS